MVLKKILVAVLAVVLAAPAMNAEKLKYRNPTGKEFPILAWFSILGDSNLTKARYQELREAGFNISFSHFHTSESLDKGFRACRGTGVKIMASCDDLEHKTAATVRRFKGEPDLVGWFLTDEPTTRTYPRLKAYRDRVLAYDDKHLLYLNLFPCMTGADFLGAKSYEDYVQRFVDEVGLNQISYDMYPVVHQDGKTFVRPEFYENLEIISRVAKRNGQPFWAFCMCTPHMVYPPAKIEYLRLEAFAALAYGAQCIQYFTYWTPLNADWDYHDAPIDSALRRTAAYYRVKQVNREIQALRHVFLGSEAEDVSFTGAITPDGTKPFTRLPARLLSLQTDGKGALVSRLKNGRRRYVVVVNRDIFSPQILSLRLDKGVKRVWPTGRETRLAPGDIDIKLQAGGYVILRTK